MGILNHGNLKEIAQFKLMSAYEFYEEIQLVLNLVNNWGVWLSHEAFTDLVFLNALDMDDSNLPEEVMNCVSDSLKVSYFYFEHHYLLNSIGIEIDEV